MQLEHTSTTEILKIRWIAISCITTPMVIKEQFIYRKEDDQMEG